MDWHFLLWRYQYNNFDIGSTLVVDLNVLFIHALFYQLALQKHLHSYHTEKIYF
jgi:hypothetical protein